MYEYELDNEDKVYIDTIRSKNPISVGDKIKFRDIGYEVSNIIHIVKSVGSEASTTLSEPPAPKTILQIKEKSI